MGLYIVKGMSRAGIHGGALPPGWCRPHTTEDLLPGSRGEGSYPVHRATEESLRIRGYREASPLRLAPAVWYGGPHHSLHLAL